MEESGGGSDGGNGSGEELGVVEDLGTEGVGKTISFVAIFSSITEGGGSDWQSNGDFDISKGHVRDLAAVLDGIIVLTDVGIILGSA